MNNFLSTSQKYTILYFYPRDSTPGCTLEANDFERLKADFEALDIEIIGVSKDSEKSHENFCTKNNLTFRLISDENLELHNQFWTFWEKKNYGKIVQGVIRSTFLLDSETGNILKEWRNVKATGHAERVLDEIKNSED